MTDTPNLALERLAAGQASAEVTHNSAINKLDTLAQMAVVSSGDTAPPGSPNEGDSYIVGASATGDWSGRDGDVAMYYSGWVFVTPKEGVRAWVSDEDRFIVFDGTVWLSLYDVVVVKSVDEIVNNSNVAQDDDELLFPMEANGKYVFEVSVFFTSTAVADIRFELDEPSGSNTFWGGFNDQQNRVSLTSGALTNFGGDGLPEAVKLHGYVENGGNAGDWNLKWAQNVAEVSDTEVHKGSVLRWRRVG